MEEMIKEDIKGEREERVKTDGDANIGRKDRIREWLKDRYNLAFLGILILGIAIRWYYFLITKSQPLWWDEADYLAYAKNLAGFDIGWIVSAKHNSLYSYLIAGIFKIGLGEVTAKFLLQFLPSVLTIIVVYLLANEMYKDKRIGLIASFLMAVFWVHLFNTTRFHIDISGFFFGLLAIYFFWKGYEKKEKIFGISARWAIPISAILAVLAYSIRRGYFIFGLFIIFYVVLSKNWRELIKDRYNWTGLIIGLIMFFAVEKTIFISGIAGVGESYFHEELPIKLYPLQVFESFFKIGGFNLWFYLFWIGLILMIVKIALSFGHIKNNKGDLRADLFNIIIIIITLAFFIFVLRNPEGFGEPRWYLPVAFSSFVCISRASLFISDYIKPYSKYVAVIVLLVLIVLGGYYQYKLSDGLIKEKVNSFSGIKEASLLLKQISNKEDVILTMGQPQVEYYSERKTANARAFVNVSHETEEHFYKTVDRLKEEENVKYILISFSEPTYPLWMKKEGYTADGRIASWEIPFMQTKIDFTTGEQQINRAGSYDTLSFELVDVKQEVFIYEIKRENDKLV